MECKLLHCDHQVGAKGARGLCPRHYQYLLRTGTPTKRCATCDRPIDRAVYCDDDCKPRCEVDGCVEPIRKRDWCASHYAQQQRTGQEPTPFAYKWGQPSRPRAAEAKPVAQRKRTPRPLCSVDGCDLQVRALGLCSKHEARFRRNGDPLVVQRTWSELQPCVVCGSESRTIQSRRFCSPRCEAHFNRHEGNPPTSKPCATCGTPIDLTETGRAGYRRRATTKLCPGCARRNRDAMTPAELAERDGTACGICGETVDLALRRSDSPMCPSVDHIMPRALGGTDDPANLQLAHLTCNVKKGASVPLEVF